MFHNKNAVGKSHLMQYNVCSKRTAEEVNSKNS